MAELPTIDRLVVQRLRVWFMMKDGYQFHCFAQSVADSIKVRHNGTVERDRLSIYVSQYDPGTYTSDLKR